MDILHEAKKEAQKERLVHFYKIYGKYFIGLLFISLICSVSYLWWESYQENIVLEEAGEYNEALSAKKSDMINKLEPLKEKKSIYADLAHLQLATVYLSAKDFNKAIHNYEQFIKRNSINNLYLDYAKLMLIKTKLVYDKISNEIAIKLLKEYLDNSTYFQNIARIIIAALLVDKKESKEEASSELNFVITDINAPTALISLAKVIQKKISEN